MDRQSVYTLSLFGESRSGNGEESNKQLQKEIVTFVLEFHLDGAYIYRYSILLLQTAKRELTVLTLLQ